MTWNYFTYNSTWAYDTNYRLRASAKKRCFMFSYSFPCLRVHVGILVFLSFSFLFLSLRSTGTLLSRWMHITQEIRETQDIYDTTTNVQDHRTDTRTWCLGFCFPRPARSTGWIQGLVARDASTDAPDCCDDWMTPIAQIDESLRMGWLFAFFFFSEFLALNIAVVCRWHEIVQVVTKL